MGGFNIAVPQTQSYSAPNIQSEPNEGNSLIKYIRSLESFLGKSGPEDLAAGRGLINAGVQGTADAAKTMNPAVDYWTKLLSGDHAQVAQALAPEIKQLSESNQTAMNDTATFGGRGGGRTEAMTKLPFQTAGQVNNLVAGARTNAAAALPQATSIQGQLAGQIGQFGMGQAGFGINGLQLASNTGLGVRGQDVAEHGQMMDMATKTAGMASSHFKIPGIPGGG
jgi:hypothetical protein